MWLEGEGRGGLKVKIKVARSAHFEVWIEETLPTARRLEGIDRWMRGDRAGKRERRDGVCRGGCSATPCRRL